jgi:hypothetical protein
MQADSRGSLVTRAAVSIRPGGRLPRRATPAPGASAVRSSRPQPPHAAARSSSAAAAAAEAGSPPRSAWAFTIERDAVTSPAAG